LHAQAKQTLVEQLLKAKKAICPNVDIVQKAVHSMAGKSYKALFCLREVA